MQVRTPAHQHAVMIEAVENHMPEVIVIDEIGTELEAAAARTIAERGVQLIGTAHGNSLDNLMINPTLSDLIGGIQSVTLGDEEARRRRTQKSVLERKAPPTFDVVVEIQDRDRVTVHADVAETVDALLRGDPLAPELRWRDEGGVHRSQARPRPGPATQLPGERFGGLVGAGQTGWRMDPGWRPDARRGELGPGTAASGDRGRTGYRPGATGGWRGARGRSSSRPSGRGDGPPPFGPGDVPGADRARMSAVPFQASGVADRGPLERGTPAPEPRARDAREFERQAEWRASAARAIATMHSDLEDDPDTEADAEELEALEDTPGVTPGSPQAMAAALADEPDGRLIRLSDGREEPAVPLETINVLGFGVSRKRLEQAIRDLRLPVYLVRDADDADVVITLRNHYKQKAPALREAEERGLPVFVLKSNTSVQIEACLASLFALDTDPSEAGMREVEEAIGLVRSQSRPVELSPQSASVRRLQHLAVERANLVSVSSGREPYRRVRVYPDTARVRR
jgi:hypothetical protein